MVLKELTALRGVAGDEGAVRAYLREKVEAIADEVCVDRIGNLIAFKRGTKPGAKHALLCAHMDEVGFIVTGIRDDGFVRFAPVGSIDPRVVISKRVKIGEKAHPGVIGAKAIHLQSADEFASVMRMSKMCIDIGAKDKASAEKRVKPGDYVSFDSEWQEFGEGLVKTRALDDRVGCLTLLRALEGRYPVDISCAFTVQEETGLRGATVVGHTVKADLGIVLEGTSANDLGDVPAHQRVCKLGGGVAISFMDRASVAHRGLNEALRGVAEKHRIPWQIKTYVSGGNDSGPIQRGAGAMPTCVLSVPCRYIHSPSSVAALSDIEAQFNLVDAFLGGGAEF